jgi:hypothetical protein
MATATLSACDVVIPVNPAGVIWVLGGEVKSAARSGFMGLLLLEPIESGMGSMWEALYTTWTFPGAAEAALAG